MAITVGTYRANSSNYTTMLVLWEPLNSTTLRVHLSFTLGSSTNLSAGYDRTAAITVSNASNVTIGTGGGLVKDNIYWYAGNTYRWFIFDVTIPAQVGGQIKLTVTVDGPTTVASCRWSPIKVAGDLSRDPEYPNLLALDWPTAPSIPTSLSCPAETLDTVLVQWAASTAGTYSNSVLGYLLNYQTSPDNASWGEWHQLILTGTATSYGFGMSAYGIARGSYVRFTVQARGVLTGIDSAASGVSSSCRRALEPGNVPSADAAPLICQASSVSVTWLAAAPNSGSLTKYRVYLAEKTPGGSWGAFALVAEPTGLSYTVTVPNRTAGHQFKWGITAVNSYGLESLVKTESDVVTQNTAPTAATAITPSLTLYESGSMTLTWSGASDVDSNIVRYDLYAQRSMDEGATWSSWVKVGEKASTTSGDSLATTPASYTSLLLARGYLFRFAVKTVDAFGLISDLSVTTTSVRFNRLPTTPANLLIDPTPFMTALTLSWNASTDADSNLDHYEIEYSTSTDGVTWSSWLSLRSQVEISYAYSPAIADGTHIRYRVRAVDALGAASSWSATVSSLRDDLPGIKCIWGGSVRVVKGFVYTDSAWVPLEVHFYRSGTWVDGAH